MLGGIFHFIQVLIENMLANSGDPDQTPHSVASDLGMRCLSMSLKKNARHLWVKKAIILLSKKFGK